MSADLSSPPPERGRSATPASSRGSRVGLTSSRFDLTREKTKKARRLRQNATTVEARLWAKLRGAQIDGRTFRRQHPAGPYVLDFYCTELQLAIELDGGQHNADAHAARDRERDRWLPERGVTTLRFWNSDVIENLPGVLETIAMAAAGLAEKKVSPTRRWRADLPLSGGGISKQRS